MTVRADVITRRTYLRPINEQENLFETWPQAIDRVISHQRWLWERAAGRPLNGDEHDELHELRDLLLNRQVSVAGRTLWLGGTPIAKRREASQFNCSFIRVETVHDVVDVLWLLLQGCGVGFEPCPGTLNGFTRQMKLEVVRSERTAKGGAEHNEETWDAETRTWTIRVGDSAEAWAKSIGKILAGKYPAERLVLDFSEIRPAGLRLSGYGWISSGDRAIAKAYTAIVAIMNRRAGKLLRKMDILDVVNWLGTVLSSRRSAEIALCHYGSDEWQEFTEAKKDYYRNGNDHRSQSNNSLVFYHKPSMDQLCELVDKMIDSGGSEPGMINGAAARRRAPWFSGVNPCAEILLANKSFCNLVEVDLAKFQDDNAGLERAVYLIARANYRQTLVNLDDGILQRTWHENNEYLRLCGVSLTGIARRPDLTPYDFRTLRSIAHHGAYSMADAVGYQRPKLVTTIKPSGTISKVMDTTEGCHKPLGRFIFNNVAFSRHDPVVPRLREANYRVFDHPKDAESVLVTFPVRYDDVPFTRVDGKEVNQESAWDQLERYRMLMDNYVDHNCSITISYDPAEKHSVIEWFDRYWDGYVGVSFLFRADPTKTAADLGAAYLPQEVVTEPEYDRYVQQLKAVDLDGSDTLETIDVEDCPTGACPVR